LLCFLLKKASLFKEASLKGRHAPPMPLAAAAAASPDHSSSEKRQ